VSLCFQSAASRAATNNFGKQPQFQSIHGNAIYTGADHRSRSWKNICGLVLPLVSWKPESNFLPYKRELILDKKKSAFNVEQVFLLILTDSSQILLETLTGENVTIFD
jgi:hypothetical protein